MTVESPRAAGARLSGTLGILGRARRSIVVPAPIKCTRAAASLEDFQVPPRIRAPIAILVRDGRELGAGRRWVRGRRIRRRYTLGGFGPSAGPTVGKIHASPMRRETGRPRGHVRVPARPPWLPARPAAGDIRKKSAGTAPVRAELTRHASRKSSQKWRKSVSNHAIRGVAVTKAFSF